jgi:hypothetical protein
MTPHAASASIAHLFPLVLGETVPRDGSSWTEVDKRLIILALSPGAADGLIVKETRRPDFLFALRDHDASLCETAFGREGEAEA